MAETDYSLHNKVGELQHMVAQLDRSLAGVGQQVASVGAEQRTTRAELTSLYQEFKEYVAEARRRADLQLAQTRVGVLQDELDHKFGQHNRVRDTATGMLQAFDSGLVSEETVRTVGEQLMVQTPRYWLAPLLVALAAWAGDNQALCERAVTEAFRRSPDKVSLFMALLLRRQGRQTGAVRWLRHYLNAQDPTALGRDFAVILEAISQGAFGPAGVTLVQEHLERWQEQLLGDEAAQQAQVDRWRMEIDGYVGPSATARFPRLAKLSPQWPALDRALARAGAHRSLIDRYTRLLAEEHPPADRLENAIDDILDRLVREYDPEELPLRRELQENQAVVDHGGDLAAARRSVDMDAAAMERTLDYLTIQTTSALNPDAIGVSAATQRLALASCHEWFLRAHAGFTMDYRKAVPPAVAVTLDRDHHPTAVAIGLPAWTGSFTQPMDQLEKSLDNHWQQHGSAHVASLGYDARKHWLILAAVMIPATIVVSLCSPALGIAGGLIAAGIWALAISQQAAAAARRQEEAEQLVLRGSHESRAVLRAAGAEVTDWGSAYREADALEPKVRGMIGDLATAGHAGSPYERRVVGTARPAGGNDGNR